MRFVTFGVPVLLGLFLGAGAVPSCAAPAPSGRLSASQVMRRCRQAYRGLSSYRLAFNVTIRPFFGKDSPFGADAPETVHAEIRYVRPNLLSMQGRLVTRDEPTCRFTLLCNSNGSWVTLRRGKRLVDSSHYQNTTLGNAALTGVTQDAGSIFPAILLHSDWAYPQGLKARFPHGTVTNAVVEGRPCYRVALADNLGETYWIEKKTFLILKFDNGDLSETVTFSRPGAKLSPDTFRPTVHP